MNHISLLTFSLVIICISQQHLSYSWGWFSFTHDTPYNYDNPSEQHFVVITKKTILDQSKEIAASQSELREGQTEMIRKLEAEMEMLHESYQNLGQNIERLRGEMVEIKKEIQEVTNTMSLKMTTLQKKADDIGEVQEAFKSKYASMFMALDKLFMLYNAILLESRSIKAFFFYSAAIFVLYILTSAKQTYHLRGRLYLVLCATFLAEFAMCRSGQNVDQQTWLPLVRSSFVVVACIQSAYSIFTYRDYEMLNHKMLNTLMEKINTIENMMMHDGE